MGDKFLPAALIGLFPISSMCVAYQVLFVVIVFVFVFGKCYTFFSSVPFRIVPSAILL